VFFSFSFLFLFFFPASCGIHNFHPSCITLFPPYYTEIHITKLTIQPPEIEAPSAQPAAKKRKTGPVSAAQIPADKNEVKDNGKNGANVLEDDSAEDYDEEDEEANSIPASKAPYSGKGGAVPADNDLEEVDEAVAADEDDEDDED